MILGYITYKQRYNCSQVVCPAGEPVVVGNDCYCLPLPYKEIK